LLFQLVLFANRLNLCLNIRTCSIKEAWPTAAQITQRNVREADTLPGLESSIR